MEFDPETKKIAIIVPLLFNLKYTLKISDAETRIKLLSKEIQSITAAESYDENVKIFPSLLQRTTIHQPDGIEKQLRDKTGQIQQFDQFESLNQCEKDYLKEIICESKLNEGFEGYQRSHSP